MAARKNRTKLSDTWKEKIAAGRILERLIDHVTGEIDMSATQIAAARTLLNKVYPDLKAVELDGSIETRTKRVEIVRKDYIPMEEEEHSNITVQ